jgi:hypothetical protein
MLEQETPRDASYWAALRDHLESQVAKFSGEMETLCNWKGPSPWFRFAFDWNEHRIRAFIRRDGLHPEIGFSLGLLRWLDSIAFWLNHDGTFRTKLQVFEARPHADLSQWMIHRWTDWIFRHEIGHFFCGHLSRVADVLVEGEPRPSESIELTRAMEFDADMFAALMYFGFLHQCFGSNIYQDFYGTADVRAVFWDLGMLFGAFFTAFEELTPHDVVTTHPPVAVRWHIFQIEGMGTYSRLLGKPSRRGGPLPAKRHGCGATSAGTDTERIRPDAAQ